MTGKAKFRHRQVVRIDQHYFKIRKVQYSADRCAPWDNGWWYWEDEKTAPSENRIRQLTKAEKA
jgi:hypothetical protein